MSGILYSLLISATILISFLSISAMHLLIRRNELEDNEEVNSFLASIIKAVKFLGVTIIIILINLYFKLFWINIIAVVSYFFAILYFLNIFRTVENIIEGE